MLSSLDQAVLLTITYTAQFEFPLTAREVHQRLLINLDGRSITSSRKIFSLGLVKKSLDYLVRRSFLKKTGDYYTLVAQEKHIAVRQQRAKFSLLKTQELDRLINKIKYIPWVQAVVITGALAMKNTPKDDDADLLIITSKNRLWLSRFLVTVIILAMGRKQSAKKFRKNSWCSNLWLSTDNLGLPKKRHSVYTAYEVCQTNWVYDRGGVEREFYKKNAWVKTFLPNYLAGKEKHLNSDKLAKTRGLKIINLLEKLIFLLQYAYMWPRITREKINPNAAFFHPRDTKRRVYAGWLKQVRVVG